MYVSKNNCYLQNYSVSFLHGVRNNCIATSTVIKIESKFFLPFYRRCIEHRKCIIYVARLTTLISGSYCIEFLPLVEPLDLGASLKNRNTFLNSKTFGGL